MPELDDPHYKSYNSFKTPSSREAARKKIEQRTKEFLNSGKKINTVESATNRIKADFSTEIPTLESQKAA